MTTMPIVVVQPPLERGGAVGGAGEGGPVRPFAQHGANEALGLAIGPRRVRPRTPVNQALRAAGGLDRASRDPFPGSYRRPETEVRNGSA